MSPKNVVVATKSATSPKKRGKLAGADSSQDLEALVAEQTGDGKAQEVTRDSNKVEAGDAGSSDAVSAERAPAATSEVAVAQLQSEGEGDVNLILCDAEVMLKSVDEAFTEKELACLVPLTVRVVEAQRKGFDATLEICRCLAEAKKFVADKPVRKWIEEVLGFDRTYAFSLMNVGAKIVVPLLDSATVDIEHLREIGIGKLITVSRYPDDAWGVEDGVIWVLFDGDNRVVSELDKQLLRLGLRIAKGVTHDEFATLLETLECYELDEDGQPLPFEAIKERAKPAKKMLTPRLIDLRDKSQKLAEAQEKKITEQRFRLEELEGELSDLERQLETAERWISLLSEDESDPEAERERLTHTVADLEQQRDATVEQLTDEEG